MAPGPPEKSVVSFVYVFLHEQNHSEMMSSFDTETFFVVSRVRVQDLRWMVSKRYRPPSLFHTFSSGVGWVRTCVLYIGASFGISGWKGLTLWRFQWYDSIYLMLYSMQRLHSKSDAGKDTVPYQTNDSLIRIQLGIIEKHICFDFWIDKVWI